MVENKFWNFSCLILRCFCCIVMLFVEMVFYEIIFFFLVLVKCKMSEKKVLVRLS